MDCLQQRGWVNPATISVKSVFDCIKEVQGDKCVCLGQVQSVNDNWVGDINKMQCVRLTGQMCNQLHLNSLNDK